MNGRGSLPLLYIGCDALRPGSFAVMAAVSVSSFSLIEVKFSFNLSMASCVSAALAVRVLIAVARTSSDG